MLQELGAHSAFPRVPKRHCTLPSGASSMEAPLKRSPGLQPPLPVPLLSHCH